MDDNEKCMPQNTLCVRNAGQLLPLSMVSVANTMNIEKGE